MQRRRHSFTVSSQAQRRAVKSSPFAHFAGAPCFAPFAKRGCFAFACHCHRERSQAHPSDLHFIFRGCPMLRAFCEAWVPCFCLSLLSRAQRSTPERSAFCISRVPHASRLLRSVDALLLLVIVSGAQRSTPERTAFYISRVPHASRLLRSVGVLLLLVIVIASAAKRSRAIPLRPLAIGISSSDNRVLWVVALATARTDKREAFSTRGTFSASILLQVAITLR